MYFEYFVYIMTNKHHTVLYTGFSDDTYRRTIEHKDGLLEGFTKKYNVHKLVYFERHYDKDEALKREYLIKRWKRAWKIDLINSMNPEWKDLFDDFISD